MDSKVKVCTICETVVNNEPEPIPFVAIKGDIDGTTVNICFLCGLQTIVSIMEFEPKAAAAAAAITVLREVNSIIKSRKLDQLKENK